MMRKKRSTLDDAIEEYKAQCGVDIINREMMQKIIWQYLMYRNEWRHYDDFKDWLVYHQ